MPVYIQNGCRNIAIWNHCTWTAIALKLLNIHRLLHYTEQNSMPANYLFTEANDWLYNVTDPLFEEIKKLISTWNHYLLYHDLMELVPMLQCPCLWLLIYMVYSTVWWVHICYYSSLARATAQRFQEELLNYIYCTFFKRWLFPCI